MTSVSVHQCECRQCRSSKPHAHRLYHQHINLLLSRLNEPQRRWFVALEAMHMGYGGRRLLEQITGMSHTTILRGCEELASGLADCPDKHLRVPGGGRPAAEERDPGLERALESMLDSETAGDPMGREAKAKRSSLKNLSTALVAAGHPASGPTVAKLLRKLGYSPKANARRVEVRGASPAQRNEQFEHIAQLRDDFVTTHDPIISVDTKKKK